MVWSRDPDGSQHNQGDSLNALTPGINRPTSLAAIKDADDNLEQIMQVMQALNFKRLKPTDGCGGVAEAPVDRCGSGSRCR